MTLKTVVMINDEIQLFYNLFAVVVTSLSSTGRNFSATYLENITEVDFAWCGTFNDCVFSGQFFPTLSLLCYFLASCSS